MGQFATQYAGGHRSDRENAPSAAVFAKRPVSENINLMFILFFAILIGCWYFVTNENQKTKTALPGFGGWADDSRTDEDIIDEIRALRHTNHDKDLSF
jgi:hypothetical protein